MSKNNGGPAFPTSSTHIGGMSLRDYFAAAALTGLIASGDDGAGDRIADLPKYAYHIAAAMLKARES